MNIKAIVVVLALTVPAPVLAQVPTATSAPTATEAASARPRVIPSSEFANESLVSRPVISPDGARIVGRVTTDGKERVGVFTLDGSARSKLVAVPTDHDLRWYRWAGNGRVLISMARTVPFFGDEAVATRLFVWDLQAGAITPVGSKIGGLEGDDLLYVDPDGQWVLLSFQQSIYDYPSVSRVDLATNKTTQVVPARLDQT